MDLTQTVSKIVLDHPEAAAVFQDRHIDFCCKGGRTLAEAAAAAQLDPADLSAAVEKAIASRTEPRSEDPRSFSTPVLVTYIVSRHHAFLREALPFLVPLSAKVARVHGDHDPRLREVLAEFSELRDVLEAHLEEEEQVLFREAVDEAPDRARLRRELDTMRKEHEEVGQALRRIRTLTDDYTPPEWGCSSYRTLLAELRRLEDDVLRHVHLENDVLVPRFLAN